MKFADLLTYADIDHLKRMALHYGCGEEDHSKNGLISKILFHLGGQSQLKGELEALSPEESRFLQQLCFDSRSVFSMEELLAKGSVCAGDKGNTPRDLVILGLRKGWLFPGVTGKKRALFEVPEDLRRRYLRLFKESIQEEEGRCLPSAYRDEEGLLEEDLFAFLHFLSQEELQLTTDGAIYRQQQRKLMNRFHVGEKPVSGKGWRFGFGRRYHQYPERFSLLYDYAYFRGYILEDEWEGRLYLSEAGVRRLRDRERGEGEELYRFWLRLYRRPIPQLAIVVKWIDLLCQDRWQPTHRWENVVRDWLRPYYYESEQDLFRRILRMMMHLGLLRIGESDAGERLIRMTPMGHARVSGISGFTEKGLEKRYVEISSRK